MMDFVLNLAEESGFQVVALGVWENKLRDIRFYQKLGFEMFGQHSFLLGTDGQMDWIMARKV